MAALLLTVVTPMRRTSSGSLFSACDTRFCTCTCAVSALVPLLNVTVRVIEPVDEDCEDMYSMFSTPVIACSSGAATVSATTAGLAPGYSAETTTEGGATSGYSLMGSRCSAMKPARKIMIEITPAKIGRSMKKCANFMATQPPLPAAGAAAAAAGASPSMGTMCGFTTM